jgi:hypothetical protein
MSKVDTQRESIRHHLETFGRITPKDAYEKYGCFRLAARIHELRAEGLDIDTRMVPSEDGNPFAEYTLENKKAGRDETHSGLLSEIAHATSLTGEQSRKVSFGFQGGDRNT